MVVFFAINFIPYLFSSMQMTLADTHVQAEMNAYGSWLNMLIPFLIGIIFGFYYLKYRSLAVLIIAHISTLLILGVLLF
jgi:membrane protease YdiL (CAAX protease family)